jgi:ankyrin repeat domain-containing protein 13
MEQPSNSSTIGLPKSGDPPNFELHRAAYEGDLSRVQACIERGDDVNVRDKHGNSPLSLALHFMRKDVANFLLQNGADPTLKSKAGWSPIHEALASGSKDLVTAVHCALEKDSRNSFQKKLIALREALIKVRSVFSSS